MKNVSSDLLVKLVPYFCCLQIVQYVNELNNLESRKGRKPLDVNNVVYWFKNARAAQKRAEVRNINSGTRIHYNLLGSVYETSIIFFS